MSKEPTNLEVLLPENQPPELVPVKLKQATTLHNLWWKWVGTKVLRPNTVLEYNTTGRRFTEFFRNRRLSPEELLAWHEFVRDLRSYHGAPIKPQMVNRIHTKVRSFLRWLHEMRYVTYDLRPCVPLVAAPATTQPIAITEEQYQAIKQWCKGRHWTEPHLWLVILAYRTGMSLVDCCHLRWKDVHLDDNGPSYIDIYRQKMKRMGEKALCQIPIIPGSDLHTLILERRKVENYKRFDGINDYVHQDCPGLYDWNGFFDSLRRQMRRIFKGAGIPKGTTFRNLRNSLCSNLVNAGVPIALVCKITGHSNPKTLMIYLKPDRIALQDGMAKAHQYSEAQGDKLKPNNNITLNEP